MKNSMMPTLLLLSVLSMYSDVIVSRMLDYLVKLNVVAIFVLFSKLLIMGLYLTIEPALFSFIK